MDKQFLDCQLFRNGKIRIAAELHALGLTLQTHGLDIGFQNGLIAHNPYHLVNNAVLGGHRVDRGLLNRVIGSHASGSLGCNPQQQHRCEEDSKYPITFIHEMSYLEDCQSQD